LAGEIREHAEELCSVTSLDHETIEATRIKAPRQGLSQRI
jgi:hypothetical protein